MPKTLLISMVDDDAESTPMGCGLSRLKPPLRATFEVSAPSTRLSAIKRGGNERRRCADPAGKPVAAGVWRAHSDVAANLAILVAPSLRLQNNSGSTGKGSCDRASRAWRATFSDCDRPRRVARPPRSPGIDARHEHGQLAFYSTYALSGLIGRLGECRLNQQAGRSDA